MYVCNHLFDERHTYEHRMIIGMFLMPTGVLISKLFASMYVLHFICDMVGYAIHGIGVVPIVDYAIAKSRGEDQKVVEVTDENKEGTEA